ncbi:MAG: DUF3179 domain-containing protein [Chryseotalea sp. WA131a]|nr:MAG: DUF3179 domain-containing protein [Chryseotalea sp. WA131a]
MRIALFLVGILILIVAEVARVYYIMPFPGSQVDEVIDLAYFIDGYIWIFRIIGIAMIAYPAFTLLGEPNRYIKFTGHALLIFWVLVVYMFNFRFLADKMFYQPSQKIFAPISENKVSAKKIIIGVAINGQAKAFPIEVIGYHHQVRDTIGGEPLMITYCTVCRTGRVFSPIVNNKLENFRLVGMDHYNAMFEDETTKSWWRQVNGEAIAGPLLGTTLTEVPSEQMSLQAWMDRYPNTLVMQPDPAFKDRYESLEKYDEGKMEGKLEGRDSLSWKDKSWVVGVPMGLFAKAYDWNQLVKDRVINDRIKGLPVMLALESDSVSFHSWVPVVGKDTLRFSYSDSLKILVDQNQSRWNWKGECVEGTMNGTKLETVQSYQEFWHSWKTFHPNTEIYKDE